MDFVTSVIFPLVVLAVAFIGMQVFVAWRMKRMEGAPAPQVGGDAGQRIAGGESALFYFYSPQCGACRTMTPVVKELAGQGPGVFAVDITQDMDTARRFGVMATPTTVVVKQGTVSQVLVGAQSPDRLRSLVPGASAPA